MDGKRRWGITVLAGLTIAALIGACAQGDGSASGSDGDGGSALRDNFAADQDAAEVNAVAPAAQAAYGGSAGGGGTTGAVARELDETPAIGPSVIKTADMSLEVERGEFQDSLQDAIATAGRFGGFVLSTSIDDGRGRSGYVTLRVPAESFEDALAELEGLGKVEGQSIVGRDVSQQFIDLDARIRNFEAQEVVLLRLMGEANTVADSIRVQHELQSIQLEIERLKGRLRFLRDQAEMSTISMRLFEAGLPPGTPKIGVLGRAWDRAMAVALAVVSAVIVGTGALVPVAVLLALAYLVVRAVRLRTASSS